MTHARCSASAAYRWMKCPGSVALAEKCLQTTSTYAEEGIRAHALAAAILGGAISSASEEVMYYVRQVEEATSKIGWRQVEVDLTPVLSKLDPDLGGTADAIIYDLDGPRLQVWDLKYGAGLGVEVEDNEQLLIYAVGALLIVREPVEEVTVVVCQPRYEHVEGATRFWTFKAVEILAFIDKLIEAVRATRAPDAPLFAGSHCKFCPAAATCPELEKQHHALVSAEFNALERYDPSTVGKALDMIPQLETRIKALRELGYTMAVQGQPPAGYKLVEKRAMRKWREEPKGIFPPEFFEPSKLKSPAQVEELIGKKQFAHYAEYVEKKSSGMTLAPLSDNRAPATVLSIEEFSVMGGTEMKAEANPPLLTFGKE